uniref:Uncharacterized protein n=1 Tax=Capra hircus TaxID=9925 RepID=A0A452DLR0_CAPHI
MSEMNKLLELYEESNDLQMDVMPGESDLPHIKRGPSPGEQPGQITGLEFQSEGEGKEFDDWEEDYDSPEEEPLSAEGYRVSAALEEAAKMFLRTSRAREKTLFDQLAFIGEFSLRAVSRLTEELGCDEIIDREEEEAA